MKTVKINLYEFKELKGEAREKAIFDHKNFLDNELIDFEDENGVIQREYHEHTGLETIDSIEANEYLFFNDGSLANCVTYVNKHPKAGATEFKFKGEVFKVVELSEADKTEILHQLFILTETEKKRSLTKEEKEKYLNLYNKCKANNIEINFGVEI